MDDDFSSLKKLVKKREWDKPERQTRELMEIFSRAGVLVPLDIVEEIIERDDVYTYLTQIVKKDKFWRRDGVGDGWPPIHSLYILTKQGDKRSLELLQWMVKNRVKELGDYVTEELPSIFYSFLPRFFKKIQRIAHKPSYNKYVRLAALKALCTLAITKEERTKKVIESCHLFLTNSDTESKALAAPYMAKLRNKNLYERIKTFFKNHPESEIIISFQEVENIYQGKSNYPQLQKVKRLEDYFSYEHLVRLYRNYYGDKYRYVEFKGTTIPKREVRGVKAIMSLIEQEPSFSIKDNHFTFLGLSSTNISDITPLIYFNKLQELKLRYTYVTNITPLQNLQYLQKLDLNSTIIPDITPLQDLKKLRCLNLGDVASRRTKERIFSDISPLTHLRNLRFLNLCGTRVADLSPLEPLIKLDWLSLQETNISSIQPLQNKRNLEYLNFASTTVSDLSPVKQMTKLRVLTLSKTPVEDISPIKHLTQLRRLNLYDTNVTDISPLKNLKNLKVLTLGESLKVKNKKTVKILEKRGTTIR